MDLNRFRIPRSARLLVLALGTLILPASSASAQYFGYGGSGYGGLGYGGFGYGGIGYGYGGYGGYGGLGYGGLGYGGIGYGGYGGIGYGGYGYGYPGYGFAGYGAGYPDLYGASLGGVGYPGFGLRNPYFSAGLSPLAVENVFLERAILGRTTPAYRSVRGYQGVSRPANSGAAPVGTGTFSTR